MKTFLLLAFTVCIFVSAQAQLCSGSLGDPLINVTFGTKSLPMHPKGTTLKYTSGCPGKEEYTLKNLVFGCGDNHSWLTVAGDHTHDVGGNYMLVYGESSMGTVHTDTVDNLCTSINYVY